MIKKRIGTDLFLSLTVLTEDGNPVDFTNAKGMKVCIYNAIQKQYYFDVEFTVKDNVISTQFTACNNKRLGVFNIIVKWKVPFAESETNTVTYAVDFTNAFAIVATSEEELLPSTPTFIGYVKESYAKSVDPTPGDYVTSEQLTEALKGYVPAQEGMGLSENSFTKDEKAKLSELENYDDSELVKSVALKANKSQVYTKEEVNNLILSSESEISLEEKAVGTLQYGGKTYTMYELTTELQSLPTTANTSQDYKLSDTPCGGDLYLGITDFVVRNGSQYIPNQFTIEKVYTSQDKSTMVTIKCNADVIGDATGFITIRYVRGLLTYSSYTLTIPKASLGVNTVDDLTVSLPPLKYNKKMAFSYAMDDGKAGVYEYFFKYCKDNNLCCTDGCGKDVIFAFGNAWVTFNYLGVDLHNNPLQTNGMLWSNMIKMMDFGGGCYNHGGGVYDNPNVTEKTDALAKQSLEDNANAIFDKTERYPYCVVVPGGSLDYRQPFLNVIPTYDTIYDSSSSQFQPNIVKVDDTLDLKQFQHGRTNYDNLFTDGSLDELKSKFQEAYNTYDNVIYYAFSHAPGRLDLESDQLIATNTVQPLLDWIYQTYGKVGNDTVWLASYSEIYEYLFTSKNSSISKEIVGDNVVLTVKLAQLPYFYAKDMTLLLKSSGSIGDISITGSDNLTELSFGKTSDGVLINTSISQNRLALAEKYTSLYETDPSLEVKAEALYMINRLKSDLQQPFKDRVQAGEVGPVLNSISINNGDVSTYDPHLNISLNVTGGISHYRAGEISDLSQVEWIAGSSLLVDFVVTSTLGEKIVYLQVKNEFGESEVKSDTIQLVEKPAVTFTVKGVSNDTSMGTVIPATQTVGQGGNANVSATALEGYEIESWEGAQTETGIGSEFGIGSVTNVQTDITIKCNFKKTQVDPPVSNKAVVSFGWNHEAPAPPNNGSDFSSTLKATRMRLSPNGVGPADIFNEVGSKIATVTFANWTTGNDTFQGNTTGDNSGVLPDDILKRNCYKSFSYENMTMTFAGLTPGTYKFGLLINTIKTYDITQATYEVSSGDNKQQFVMKSSYVDNFNDIAYVTLEVTGDVVLSLSTSDSKNGSLVINALTIEKL